MPDQPIEEREYGTGAIQSTPDDRDWQLTDTLELMEMTVSAWTPPSKFTCPTLPPVLDQGNTPMCVAYSSSAMKSRQDRLDLAKWFDFHESLFFYQIGGGPNGAIMRNGLERMRVYGYPVVNVGQASVHRISAYYAVAKDIYTIKQALVAFGPVLMVGPWYHSWTYGLPPSKIMPRPDYGGTGHVVLVVGWDDSKGSLLFQNSWGNQWGSGGRAWMPYYYAINTMWEYWKSVDVRTGGVIVPVPPPVSVTGEPMLGAKIERWKVTTANAPVYDRIGGAVVRAMPLGTLMSGLGETIGTTTASSFRLMFVEVSGAERLAYMKRTHLTPIGTAPFTEPGFSQKAFKFITTGSL